MLFNSFQFLVFIAIVIPAYFLLPQKFRWVFLLAASYYFYMSWNVVYILLLFASTLVNYLIARRMNRVEAKRGRLALLWLSVALSFGTLFLFKYYDFTVGLLDGLLSRVGIEAALPKFNLLLPVGISFYTFQIVSYVIDVYYRRTEIERNFGKFALYVSFFPQLVAGPIERADNLLPQFSKRHRFHWVTFQASLYRIFWGYFKKMVVADRLAVLVNTVYAAPGEYNGWVLAIATVFFAVQIYCDFSGYCDIAIGVARIMGFRLMKNFDNPYFATSIQNFWDRWHISLSTWLRDYVYIPLGGNRVGRARYIFNVMVTFIASGVWHGAGINFILWGAAHGVMVTAEKLYRNRRRTILPRRLRESGLYRLFCILLTFALVNLAWVFFRAQTTGEAFHIIGSFFTLRLSDLYLLLFDAESSLYLLGLNRVEVWFAVLSSVLLFVVERRQSHRNLTLRLVREPAAARCVVCVAMLAAVLLFGMYGENTVNQFIYFQF